ncbi:MAG TPA: serine/threonine-protein kinase [Gemmatimonadales bacterium]|nr:serine/threonine-protein kinase [Gemmatimonadales bacterium]
MPRFSKDDWAQLSPLIDEALTLSPEARAEWLRRHKVSHPTLAGELEAILNRESALEAEGFLSTGNAPPRPMVSSLLGQTLGAYTIESELGRGGMGSVWLARRTDGRFEGKAAVKFLSLAVAGPTGEARFRQEGSLLARLAHPNISRLLDAGMTPSGQPYLMLEYVDGRALDEWCDEQRLSVEARLRLFLQVLEAVGHAHANLIVHRDLKPSNILVTSDGTVKLLDFGIARLLETGSEGARRLTGTQDAVFTYQYAAPEQITGDPVSTATDVYSLGVVLYQLLTGQHPTGETAESPADHLRATLDTDPHPLSRVVTPRNTLSGEAARKLAEVRDASPDRLSRMFSGDLDNILAKALRKEPSQRYATVTAFADDLTRYLNHEPVTARPTTWGYRAGKFVRRHRGSVSSAVLVTILLVGATIMTTLQAREARLQRDNAMLQYRRSVARSTVQSDVAGEVRALDGRLLSATERIDRAARILQATYRDEPWLVSEVMLDLAGNASTAGDYEASVRLMNQASEIAEQAGAWQQAAMGRCYRAFAWLDAPEVDSARVDLDAGLAALAKAPDPLDVEVPAMCELARANMFVQTGHSDSGVAHAQRAVKYTDPRPGTQQVAFGTRFAMLNALAQALRADGRVREAADVLQRLLVETENTGTVSGAETGNAFSNLYVILHQLGEYVTTDSIWGELSRKQAEEAGAPIMSNQLRFQRGLLWIRRGRPDSADVWFTQALADTTPDKGGITWWIHPNMADLRLAQHRPKDAIPFIEAMPRVSAQSDVIRAWLKARLKYEQGDPAGALKMLEDSLAPLVALPGARTPLPLALSTAGEWRLARGDLRAADSLAQLAVQLATYDSLSIGTSAHVGRAELLIARVRRAGQDLPAAREAAERAVTALTRGLGPEEARTLEAVALRDSLR